jgi:iron complex transport system permease protein
MRVAVSERANPLAVPARGRARRARLGIGSLLLLLTLAALLSASIGAVPIAPGEILRILLAGLGLVSETSVDATASAVFWTIRLPRVVLGIFVGGALACCGALLQGLFRNPLADPALLGISGGAMFSAALFIVFGSGLAGIVGHAGLPAVAFAGALGATTLVRRLAQRGGTTDVTVLLLAGMAIAAIAGAGTGLLSFLATDTQLRALTLWSLGSLGGATWTNALWVGIPVGLVLVAAVRAAKELDALVLGEREAHHLGVEVERLKGRLVFLTALGVGVAVAASGTIGFVGLVVPHLLRLLLGPGHRALLPASALGGATLLLLADLLARTVAAPAELPIGALTALLGGPFFLYLLLRRRGHGAW